MSIEKHVLYKRFVLFCNLDLLSNQKCICGYKFRNKMVSRCCELSMEVGTKVVCKRSICRWVYDTTIYIWLQKEKHHTEKQIIVLKLYSSYFVFTFIIESFKNYTVTKIINSSVLYGYTRGIIKLAKASKMFVIFYINFDGVSP